MRGFLHRLARRWVSARAEIDPGAAYARWAASYPPDAHNPFMRLEQRAFEQLLPSLQDKRVLDVACGSGRYLERARSGGAAFACGLDATAAMLARAKPNQVPLVRGDMLALPFAAHSFDVVTCALAVGHVRNLNAALGEMARVLVPGGALVYSDFHPFAYLAGERRTFRAGNREYAIQHHVHLYAAHHAACRGAGLDIVGVHEGRTEDGGEIPAVLVIRAQRRL
jgi:malonyl-CoA O-methyltransferase